MNKRQKEVLQAQLDAEKAVLKELEKQYQATLDDINLKIQLMQSDEMTQSRIYRLEYQKTLKKQVEASLEKLHSDEYSTIKQFLSDTYTNAFVGTMYDLHGQNIPIITPINKDAAAKAIVSDTKLSEDLYTSLGVDIKKLKTTISAEITRGIAGDMPHDEIARNITFATSAPMSRAKTIARTESHRIQEASTYDAQKAAKDKGADIVKQWDSTLDGKTRPTHRQLDGQIREIDEPFTLGSLEAMFPGDFGRPEEDCNCRCASLQRARKALDEEELATLKERAEFYGLDKTDSLKEFKKKYLAADQKIQSGGHIKDYAEWNEKRSKKAAAEYEKIKKADDILAVAKAAKMTIETIATIKNHIFFDEHIKYDSVGTFDPDYDMAVAWKRLAEGNPEDRDILLLKHELLENQVEKEYNMTAAEAHEIATEKYDWDAEIFRIFGEEGEPDGLL